MATQTRTELIDDIDGGEATATVTFALDGQSFEIDLNDDNASKLRDALSAYTAHARKVGGSAPKRGGSRKPAGDGPAAKDVRAWAEAHDISVPARGRIPQAVVEQFLAAS